MKQTKRIVVFDIDGTLADCRHRQHHVQGPGKKNWAAFNREMINDMPHNDMIWLYHVIATAANSNPFVDMVMLIASGRGDDDRKVTEEWLGAAGIYPQKLYMRQSKDNRPDNIVKKEILDQIREEFGEPYMVFDDRNQVVDMWRENGVRCLQVQPGDF